MVIKDFYVGYCINPSSCLLAEFHLKYFGFPKVNQKNCCGNCDKRGHMMTDKSKKGLY